MPGQRRVQARAKMCFCNKQEINGSGNISTYKKIMSEKHDYNNLFILITAFRMKEILSKTAENIPSRMKFEAIVCSIQKNWKKYLYISLEEKVA